MMNTDSKNPYQDEVTEIVKNLTDADIQALQMLERPKPRKLRLLQMMNMAPDVIQSILHADPKRAVDESYEDYKVRQWLSCNVYKYRNSLTYNPNLKPQVENAN